MSSFATFYAPHTNIQGFQDEIYKGAQQKLEGLLRHLKNVPKVETRIAKGSPAEKIIEIVKKEGIDLIVMGTHSRTGLEKTIFGSVCDKVIKSVVCPVLSIPPKAGFRGSFSASRLPLPLSLRRGANPIMFL